MSTRPQPTILLCVCVFAHLPGAAVAQLLPPPSGQSQLDEAYYRSTLNEEMVRAKVLQDRQRQPAAGKIERWGRFELALKNQGQYDNAFTDVKLDVRYEAPDGREVEFWGFYDGNDTWRVRFMPDQAGTWRYDASFSDGSVGRKGSFECVDSDIPGMISAYEKNPIWFAYAATEPVVIRSLHVGDRFFADANNTVTDEPWDAGRRQTFLDWAGEQGYNMLSVASHYLNRASDGRGCGWNTPDLWNDEEQRPDPCEYRRLERVLDDLAAREMMVYPFAGFFGRAADFPQEEAAQDLYIRYTLARLGAYWNVLLNVGGPEPLLRGRPYLSEEEIDRLGGEIARCDVFGHLLSVHNATGDDRFMEAEWTSYGVLQGPKTTNRRRLARILRRNHHDDKPLYAQETLWPGNIHHPRYSAEDIRKNAYVIVMSAAALNFGDMAGNSSSGFSGTLDLDRKVQYRHDAVKKVWDFFQKVPYYRMKPRQDLVNRGYCLAEEGKEYLVYLDWPCTVNVTLTGGAYEITWINAQDTSDQRDGGPTSSGQDLKPPSGGDDWLLHLTRR